MTSFELPWSLYQQMSTLLTCHFTCHSTAFTAIWRHSHRASTACTVLSRRSHSAHSSSNMSVTYFFNMKKTVSKLGLLCFLACNYHVDVYCRKKILITFNIDVGRSNLKSRLAHCSTQRKCGYTFTMQSQKPYMYFCILYKKRCYITFSSISFSAQVEF